MILSAHQPAYLPWLGYFQKIAVSDMFCVLDTAQYSRGDFINRNRIKTAQGPAWLTVPVHAHGKPPICDVRISETNWQKKHVATLANAYRKTPYYERYAPELYRVLTNRYAFLTDLTGALTRLCVGWLGIEARLLYASDYDFAGKKSDYLVNMCGQLGAATFVFGSRGRSYADVAAFKRAGIEVLFQEYRDPVYRQRYGLFVPRLSIIDLLFNEGPRSLEILCASDGRYANTAKCPGEQAWRISASGDNRR